MSDSKTVPMTVTMPDGTKKTVGEATFYSDGSSEHRITNKDAWFTAIQHRRDGVARPTRRPNMFTFSTAKEYRP